MHDGIEVQSHRKTELLSGGALLIEEVIEIKGCGEMTFVVGDAWLMELFELEAGELSFISGDRCIRPRKNRFGTIYPPCSILRIRFGNIKGRWTGMTATSQLPPGFTDPMIFESDFTGPLVDLAQVAGILNSSSNRQSIGLNPAPSRLALKTKKLLDETYLIHPVIARIAARLGVTHEHLARQFKRDFSLTPSAYCHQLRIANATARLARGESIIDVSLDVGYNDLSRFYKQFRKSTTRTPGYCQAAKKEESARNTRK
jgi:AraC-like DNA-binding protein